MLMAETDQSWQEVGEKFTALGRRFKEHYEARGVSEEGTPGDGPVDEKSELKQAMDTMGEGLERVFGSIGDSLQDDEVKSQAKSAFSSLLDAIGDTFSELGDEVRNMGKSEEPDTADTAPPADEFEPDGVKELREDLKDD